MHLFPLSICLSSSPSRSFFSYHLSLNLFLSFIFALEIGSIILKKDGIIVFGHFFLSQQSFHVYLMSSILSITISSHLIIPTVSPLSWFVLSYPILSYPILSYPILSSTLLYCSLLTSSYFAFAYLPVLSSTIFLITDNISYGTFGSSGTKCLWDHWFNSTYVMINWD